MRQPHIFAIARLAAILCIPAAVQAAPAAPAAFKAPARLTQLVKHDLVQGRGRLAVTGDTVTIHYTGWLFSPAAPRQQGRKFDSSTDGQPYTFKLGAGAAIKGWDQGIPGMKVGGKRMLAVPARLGFGKDGMGPVPAKANLLFEVELLAVK